MTTDWIAIAALKLELRRWRAIGRTPQLWWRDDDARTTGPSLDRLLQTAGDRPLALAVVPDGDPRALAVRLSSSPSVTISQHGIDHCNRRPAGEPPSEFAADTAFDEIVQRIREGAARLSAAGLEPAFFTPPWNQISAELAAAIPAAGFTLVSSASPAPDVPGTLRLDSHIDILRWKGGPRFRGYGRVLKAMRRQLRQRRRTAAFDAPIGLLTHHLVHDEAAWRFLAWFAPFADQSFTWRSVQAWRVDVEPAAA